MLVLVPEMLRDELHSLGGPVRLGRQEQIRDVRVASPVATPASSASSSEGRGQSSSHVGVVGGVGHVVERAGVLVVLVEGALPALIELARGVVEVGELHDLDLVLEVEVVVLGRRVRRVQRRRRQWARGRGQMFGT